MSFRNALPGEHMIHVRTLNDLPRGSAVLTGSPATFEAASFEVASFEVTS